MTMTVERLRELIGTDVEVEHGSFKSRVLFVSDQVLVVKRVWDSRELVYSIDNDTMTLFTEVKKPVTVWVNVYLDKFGVTYKTRREADECAASDRIGCNKIELRAEFDDE